MFALGVDPQPSATAAVMAAKGKHKCRLCDFRADSITYMKRHFVTVHKKEEEQQLPCRFCNFETATASVMELHQRVVHPRRNNR
jgi:hypothetical protein